MRPSAQCPGNRLCCQGCGKPIPLLTVRNGNGFATCTHKSRGRACGQHNYWYCSDLLCMVLAVTPQEHARFAYSQATHEEILAALGTGAAEPDPDGPDGRAEAA